MKIAFSIIAIAAIILTLNFLGTRQDDLSERIKKLENEQKTELKRVADLEKKLEKMLPREVTLTAYSSEVKQTNSDPYQTAFMAPTCWWCVAVSRDMLQEGWLPEYRVYFYEITKEGKFKGLGVFKILDLMHERKKDQFDIWVPDKKLALKLGTRKVKAILLKI